MLRIHEWETENSHNTQCKVCGWTLEESTMYAPYFICGGSALPSESELTDEPEMRIVAIDENIDELMRVWASRNRGSPPIVCKSCKASQPSDKLSKCYYCGCTIHAAYKAPSTT